MKPVRAFYTALGHNGSDYANDTDFQNHIKGAIQWLICTGDKKTWDGSSWSPSGAPTTSDHVVIDGNFDTAIDGEIDACAITVNSGSNVMVRNGHTIKTEKQMRVKGNITIETGGEVRINNAID